MVFVNQTDPCKQNEEPIDCNHDNVNHRGRGTLKNEFSNVEEHHLWGKEVRTIENVETLIFNVLDYWFSLLEEHS